MKSLIATVLLSASLSAPALATLSSNDSTYLTSAMQAQLGRYAMAQLEVKSGSNASLKQLAQQIVTNSTSQTRTLDSIAKKNGVPIPTQPNVRDTYHYSQLMGLRGTALDQRFVQELQIEDALIQNNDQLQAQSGQDPALRSFAKKRNVALQSELTQLNKIRV